jgi:hypothetical protein
LGRGQGGDVRAGAVVVAVVAVAARLLGPEGDEALSVNLS